MLQMKKKVHVVQHTHWDLEWYFTNNESFIQLVYHLDEVMQALEQNQLDYYLLDGQMSLLDDYFQVCPDQKERLSKLVNSGRLQIGPWYTQTDELIVAGESIVRNLTLGMDLADSLGGYTNIGYLPDSFGQSKDMPKIYNGVGIERTVFWRGVPKDVTTDREFSWESEDGSTVLASNIKDGYFIGVGLIYGDDCQGLINIVEKGTTGDDIVLPVGGDQRFVDFNLRERINLYNEKLDNYDLVESTYDHFFEDIKANSLRTISGEFISSSNSKIHRSIYSSRYDHKYFNDKVERRMIYHAEPLMVMAEKIGIPYKKGVLDRIWKLLAKNQAHDSAGGCNSDKTNKIILERFVEADQLSYSLVDYLIRKIAESRPIVKENDLTVFNPLPWKVKKVIPVTISSKSQMVTILNEGQPVSSEIIKTVKENNSSIRRLKSEMENSSYYFVHTLFVEIDLPPFNFKTYQICEKNEGYRITKDEKTSIENETYRLTFKDGEVNLFLKSRGQLISNVIQIEDSGDEGDTYDYSPPYKDDIYTLDFKNADAQVLEGKLINQMILTGYWYVAKNLDEREQKKRTQKIPYTLTIDLTRGSKSISCHLVIDNKASDHRMRALIKTPFKNDYSYTDTPFGTVERIIEDPHIHDWKEFGLREEPTTIFPMLHYVNTHDKKGSMTVFSKGIKEYQLVGEAFGKIALTLFRSVGFLGRPDLIRRPGIASGNEFKYIATPDSQVQKSMTFKFSIQFDDRYEPAKLSKNYLDYALSLPFYQIQEINRFTTTLKYFVSNRLTNFKELDIGLKLSSDTLVFSSLRKSTEQAGFDLRLYNPDMSNSVEGGNLSFNQSVKYELVNLKGQPISNREESDTIDLGVFKAGEIKTFHIV
jgi:mannosylglycerate hydrolase